MSESVRFDNSYYPRVSLILRGKELDPQTITHALGINPHKSFKRGDIRKADKKWRHGLWMFWSSDDVRSPNVILHIEWLLKQIEPTQIKLIEILKTEKIDAQISCFWIMPKSEKELIHEVLTFEPDLLKQLALLNIKLEFDIYSPDA